MQCEAVREQLEEHRRGALASDAAASVEAHLGQCGPCRGLRAADDALAAAIRRLPRAPASPALRARVLAATRPPGRWRATLGRPWAAALAAAAVVLLVLMPWVRLGPDRAPDVLDALIASSVAEHRRLLLQLEVHPEATDDPAGLLERVQARTGLEVPPVLAGVEDLRLVTAHPTVLAGRTAALAVLRDQGSIVSTCVLLSGEGLPMPSEGRVQIEQFRPHMRPADDLQVVYWKQGPHAYLLVSGRDDPGTRQLFLTVRKAL